MKKYPKELLESLGIKELENFKESDIDLEKSNVYMDSPVIFLKTGDIVVCKPNKELFSLKTREKAKNIYIVDEETFHKWKEFVVNEISKKVELEEVTFSVEENQRLDETNVSKIIEGILVAALREGTSDIHILPKEDKTVIQFRVDGVLKKFGEYQKHYSEFLINKIKTLANMDIAQKHKPQDGQMKLGIQGELIEFRVSTCPTVYGENCVLRLQQTENLFNLKLEDLGFETEDLARYRESFTKPTGLILSVGATGQGKTTTFYLTIKELVEKFNGTKNIMTVEDPVEIKFEKITQIEVDEKQNRTFPIVLRSLLRQDPDIILIGEIRDEETAEIGVRASITGHLVLATLHANDTFNAITRLRDLGLSDQLISSTLNCILSQRLVRRLCGNCKVKMEATPEMKEAGIRSDYVYKPRGCEECNFTGYKGRTAIIEVLDFDEDMKTAISEGNSEIALKKLAREKGFNNLWKNALKKVEKGITSFEEVQLVVKKDVILNEEDGERVIDIGRVFYPSLKIECLVKNKKGYLFDVDRKGISFVFDEIYFLTVDIPVRIQVEDVEITFIPKSYRKYENKFIVGGVYKGNLTNLIEV